MERRDVLKAGVAMAAGSAIRWAAPLAAQTAQKRLSAFDPQVRALVARMTIDEKIGQMTQGELGGIRDESDIETLGLGSVLSGGNADPKEGNGLQAWTDTVDRLIARSTKTRLGIPILYGVDAVHGHNNVLGAVISPHNIGLGCTRNADLVERTARVTAEEVRATGIRWAFAPCVACPQDGRWGRTYEGYSEDPALVRRLAEAAVRGLQADRLDNPRAVLACAKHFIGDGGTSYGPQGRGRTGLDQGDTRVDEATLRRVHLQGYISAVAAGVGSIMPSYSSWNGVKVSGNEYLLTKMLKQELGFEGFLISDYNAIDQIDPDFKTAVMTSINAGMDMAMEPARYRVFIQTLRDLVNEGRVSMSRVDDAVTRILRVKCAMGLLDSKRNQLADRRLHAAFGSASHRAVAREAVRQSLVLLKHDRKALPVARSAGRIHVAGKSADNLGNQCGGWTIDWQGKTGDVTPGGTTLLSALKASVARGTQVTYARDGSGAAGANVGIVVIGETPYAEFAGDRSDLSIATEDVAAIDAVKAAGVPVVVVLYSGRPLILGTVFDRADAILAAWLPGTEGQGIVDVLLGDFKPVGKLGHSWPRSMAQVPINIGDAHYDPLFPYGFGLTY